MTEKPLVGSEYAKILGVTEKKDGYYENEEYLITWCIGHLVTLAYPEEYDEVLKKWDLNTLPFLPEEYRYTVIKNVAAQFRVIKELYNRADIDTIYYAGDAAREGLYIQALVRQKAGHNRNAKELVVWIDSQTRDEILRGIREAEPFSAPKYQNMTASGYERAIEDYATGINFSRILTLKYAPMLNMAAAMKKYVPISVGRVMTCVLGMIVNREREIISFKAIPFFKISNAINAEGFEINGNWKVTESSPYWDSPKLYDDNGFRDKEDAQIFIGELPRTVVVEKIERTTERKNAPSLFNLAELQAECSKKFKISPDTTLSIVQSLYEKKMTTYPRTDARVLSTAVAKEIRNNITGLCKFAQVSEYVQKIITYDWDKQLVEKRNTRYIDDSQISDHYAIIPTGTGVQEWDDLTRIERDVYNLIVRRFLAVFFPPAEYEKIMVTEKAGGEYFFSNSKKITKAGYLEVLGKMEENNEKQEIGAEYGILEEGKEYPARYEIKKGETAPPKRYTSGNMILAMENAGKLIEEEELRAQIKSCGIGTSATRAEMIKKLVRLEYINQNEKTQILTPSNLGNMVYEVVFATVPALLNPKITANWEKGLNSIANGEISAAEYRRKLENYVRSEAENMKNNDQTEEIARKIRPYAKTCGYERAGAPFENHELKVGCPDCGGKIKTTPFGYACENYKKENGTCKFAIGKVAGVFLTEEQISTLIQDKKTEVIKDFESKKKKKFAAALVLKQNEKGKHVIDFDFDAVKPEILKSASCPICGSDIYITPYGYGCSAYEKGNSDSCRFFIGKIAGKMLTVEQAKTLITKRKVGPLKGFVSKAGKTFEASLKIENDGKIAFDFKEEVLQESQIECPKCGNKMMKGNVFFKCECKYQIPHIVASKKLTEQEVRMLINGKTGLIKGFKSKKGKRFDAILIADSDGKVSFDFGN